jgi:hypothetical protein
MPPGSTAVFSAGLDASSATTNASRSVQPLPDPSVPATLETLMDVAAMAAAAPTARHHAKAMRAALAKRLVR